MMIAKSALPRFDAGFPGQYTKHMIVLGAESLPRSTHILAHVS